jgi:hypothetical protein
MRDVRRLRPLVTTRGERRHHRVIMSSWNLTDIAFSRGTLAGLLLVAGLFTPESAKAQTWSGGRSTPPLSELVAVDATGEANWPFGAEDVAGDGNVFQAAERSVDVRSVYAVTDGTRLWWRAYVSSSGAPDESLRLYLFVDSDRDQTTGGSAAASEIDPEFTSDPTNGGYDHVFAISGEGAVIDFWDHDADDDRFVTNSGAAQRAEAESGTDTDPLLLRGDVHGYVSGNVELAALNLAALCDAALFVRALSDLGNDLDVGAKVRCSPDADDDGVPDVVENVRGCDEDADCPAGGRCISGECRYAPACSNSGDCDAGETCDRGRCVATGGESCDSDRECDGLVCDDGTCRPCNDAGAACGSGLACGPDGRCVPGTSGSEGDGAEALVDPDEIVRGGAFTCGVQGGARSGHGWLLFLSLFFVLRRRRNL